MLSKNINLKGENMAFKEREETVLEYLKLHKEASVSELCRALFVSEPTIRRDLARLSLAKKIIRTHGGACYRGLPGENLPQELREKENADKKNEIAKKAIKLINDGNTVMVDASSTAVPLLRLLGQKSSVVVITNSTKAPMLLADTNVKTFLTGGELATNTYGLVGSYAESFIKSFNADICFFSVSNLSKEAELSDNSIAENLVRQAMLSRSKKRVLLLDSSKIGKSCISTLCSLDSIDLVVSDIDLSPLFPDYKDKFI